MNHALMDKDAEFELDAMNLVEDHLSFTGIIGKKPIFAAGMKMLWQGVAEGWVIATQDVWNHPLSVARAIKKDFAKVAKKYNIKRVQTAVRSDFDKGIRFAEWLGLENEGLMKHYGFDSSHQYRYARIF
jgi:RimJ/RimL family protein N-acetyltransferase